MDDDGGAVKTNTVCTNTQFVVQTVYSYRLYSFLQTLYECSLYSSLQHHRRRPPPSTTLYRHRHICHRHAPHRCNSGTSCSGIAPVRHLLPVSMSINIRLRLSSHRVSPCNPVYLRRMTSYIGCRRHTNRIYDSIIIIFICLYFPDSPTCF